MNSNKVRLRGSVGDSSIEPQGSTLENAGAGAEKQVIGAEHSKSDRERAANTPRQPTLEATLRARADKKEHAVGTHYTDEGLRRTFKIPISTPLKDLIEKGAIARNPDGTYSLASESFRGALRQGVIENSVERQIYSLAKSAASRAQLGTLLNSEFDYDLIGWPRQYLEAYLDSDPTGRVPLNAQQLQDILEAAFDRDATLAREFVEELNTEPGPKTLGDSTLQIASTRDEGNEGEYELLFDPADTQDLKHLVDRLDMHAWEKHKDQTVPLETQPDTEQRETTIFVARHQPRSGAVEVHDKISGTDVRKLLGGGELPAALQSALKQMAPDAGIEYAQTDSGTYRGRVIGETEKTLIQQITSHSAVVHRKDLLCMIPAVGENVRIAYSDENARVLPVKGRSKTQELGR
jgi:hypothetical protein